MKQVNKKEQYLLAALHACMDVHLHAKNVETIFYTDKEYFSFYWLTFSQITDNKE